MISNHHIISEAFNIYFNSTFMSCNNFYLPDVNLLAPPSFQLSHISFNESEVYEILAILDPTKSSGHNIINPQILKHCATVLAEPVTHIFNLHSRYCRLERIQRKAMKDILNSRNLSYKQHLTTLHTCILPLVYWLELQDMFFVKCIKEPPDNFNINQFVTFATGTTRSASFGKLIHKLSRYSTIRHFYFNQLARLWTSLPPIDTTQSMYM